MRHGRDGAPRRRAGPPRPGRPRQPLDAPTDLGPPPVPRPAVPPQDLNGCRGHGFVVETGCDTGLAEASVVDGRLVVEPLATTHKACSSPLDEQEMWVIYIVTNSPRMDLSGPTLSLHWGIDEQYWLSLEQSVRAPI
ncbi:MAG: META domain-containing protein [Ornithinibacter sp.]